MAVAALFFGFITAKSLTALKESVKFLKLSFENRKIVKTLSKNDFKNKFASSYLGIVWGFVNPFITIVMYCFVFQVAFKSGPVGTVPYVLWFICGIIPWFFFSDALPSTTNVFLEYSYLVKKVVFKIEVLPAVKIISALFVHIFFVAFIFIIAAMYGYYPDAYSVQFIYYLGAMIVLVFSVTIFTSAVILFFRDLGQIISIVMNVGFWATPIGWQIAILPGWAQRIFKLNPMYYIVTGYRDTFVDKFYFWQRPYETIYFWAFCFVVLLVGIKIFNKLKPHFSDVL
ncbi:ABC transporter permease [Clostridium sp. Sa3CVN1]|uniref:Transport permease protein n=2 Tax=Clostridium cibarium TaxID=2762247 RepID=A0ABR8PPV6_9CLOT|nr:ABC transporter permease [Clostridium cibarium]